VADAPRDGGAPETPAEATPAKPSAPDLPAAASPTGSLSESPPAAAETASPPPAEPPAREPPPPPKPPPARRRASRFAERDPAPVELPLASLRRQSRRDFVLFGAGAALAAAGFWWLLPDDTKGRAPFPHDWLDTLEARLGANPEARERFLNRALTFDDDVAEALYSPTRSIRTYRRSDVTPLPNNYSGRTPDPGYLAGWRLTVEGLASGRPETLSIDDLKSRFRRHDQVTRLVCVEGWSAIAAWGGIRFVDFLGAFPPAEGAQWARLDSAVNLDSSGNPDPYYVSIDLPTARHPQTLLATHWNDRLLPVAHGAPLRLLAPMKLGLKNIKAITKITYSAEQPPDYWNERGYSKYDGL